VQESPHIAPKVLVATDFSPQSEWAFYHALSIAVRRQARLTLLHTGPEGRRDVAWERFPGVRQTLERWGLLAPGAHRTAVAAELGVEVSKMAIRDDSPRFGITDYLRRHPTDLLIMATEGRAGLRRLINPSVADSVSYLTRSHTLMLPRDGAGLLDPATGRSSLRRILCALDPAHDPRIDLAYLKQWLPALADPEGCSG
jgi:nucleotide-binding universal stress UspA family protein